MFPSSFRMARQKGKTQNLLASYVMVPLGAPVFQQFETCFGHLICDLGWQDNSDRNDYLSDDVFQFVLPCS